MTTLLVTGGAGFIGSAFVNAVLVNEPDFRVVCIDALTYAGDRSRIKMYDCDRFRFVHGDIADPAGVAEAFAWQPDYVVHFAAESHVDRSIEDPLRFVRTNVDGTAVLLNAAVESHRTKPLRFCHVSTDEVYGALGPDDDPFTEASPYAPSSPYSAAKAAADHLVRAYHRTYGLPVVITHGSNTYGPHQHEEKLIPKTVACVVNETPIPIYGDGRQRRDWLHVRDHARGIWAVLMQGRVGETYNIGGRCEVENYPLVKSIVETICAETRRDFMRTMDLITFVEDRPGHDFRYALDTSKVERECGFTPAVPFDDGLKATVRWYLSRYREANRASA